MGTTRTDLFSEKQNELADLAKVLGHPARIAILEYLLSAQSCINHDLVEEIGLAQATISQHLKELKRAGLVQGTIDGTRMCYCINTENWNKAKEDLQNLFNLLPNNNDCC